MHVNVCLPDLVYIHNSIIKKFKENLHTYYANHKYFYLPTFTNRASCNYVNCQKTYSDGNESTVCWIICVLWLP